ncbi:MAG: hypothetical protein ACFBSE_05675 [Prochloraceae cyanobacterium]
MPTNLLIFEDNEAQQQVLANTFKPAIDEGKYKITCVDNLEEAKSLLKKNFYDVSIIDLLIEENKFILEESNEKEEYESFFEEVEEDEEFEDRDLVVSKDNTDPEKPLFSGIADYDGFLLLDFIVENKIATRPIIYTGYANYDTSQKAHSYGNTLYGYFKKTSNPLELREVVTDALNTGLPFPRQYKSRNKSLNVDQCQKAVNQLSPDRRSRIARAIAQDLPLEELESLYKEVGRIYFTADIAGRHPSEDPLDFDLERFNAEDIKTIQRRYLNGCLEKRYTTRKGQRVQNGYFFKWDDESGQRHRRILPLDHPYFPHLLAEREKNSSS